MKKLIILTIFLWAYNAEAQTKAITDEGKEVILFENGTWKFVNESDAKTLETITTNETAFSKDKSATFLLKSKKVDAGIYFDPKTWKTTSLLKSPFVEYAFINPENDGLIGMFVSESIEIPTLKNLKDLQVSIIEKRADYFKLKESEYRTVNGLKVLYMRYIANTKGMDFEYQGYFYITESGYCSALTYSQQKNFEKLKPKMDAFINGLVKVEKSAAKDTVEVYQAPPKPMSASPKKKN